MPSVPQNRKGKERGVKRQPDNGQASSQKSNVLDRGESHVSPAEPVPERMVNNPCITAVSAMVSQEFMGTQNASTISSFRSDPDTLLYNELASSNANTNSNSTGGSLTNFHLITESASNREINSDNSGSSNTLVSSNSTNLSASQLFDELSLADNDEVANSRILSSQDRFRNGLRGFQASQISSIKETNSGSLDSTEDENENNSGPLSQILFESSSSHISEVMREKPNMKLKGKHVHLNSSKRHSKQFHRKLTMSKRNTRDRREPQSKKQSAIGKKRSSRKSKNIENNVNDEMNILGLESLFETPIGTSTNAIPEHNDGTIEQDMRLAPGSNSESLPSGVDPIPPLRVLQLNSPTSQNERSQPTRVPTTSISPHRTRETTPTDNINIRTSLYDDYKRSKSLNFQSPSSSIIGSLNQSGSDTDDVP